MKELAGIPHVASKMQGIIFSGAVNTGHVFSNNLIVTNSFTGIAINTPSNCRVVHNTLYNPETLHGLDPKTPGIRIIWKLEPEYDAAFPTGNVFQNNIVERFVIDQEDDGIRIPANYLNNQWIGNLADEAWNFPNLDPSNIVSQNDDYTATAFLLPGDWAGWDLRPVVDGLAHDTGSGLNATSLPEEDYNGRPRPRAAFDRGAIELQGYEIWAHQQFGPALDTAMEDSVWGPSADPDVDGLVNLFEYGLDRDPMDGSRGDPWIEVGPGLDGRLNYEFIRRKAGNDPSLLYAVETSPTLQEGSWNGDVNGLEEVDPPESLSEALERVFLRTIDPVNPSEPLFFRLRLDY
jgi:hypothetical protein